MRLSQLEEVLFPVEEHPVYVVVRDESGERRLAAGGKKAIVDIASHRVLGIVSRDYRLVTNEEALEWAYECCRCVFPDRGEELLRSDDRRGRAMEELVPNRTWNFG